jgi:GNAT superfamily N-acetyltransferase
MDVVVGGAGVFRARMTELLGVYRAAFLEIHEADPDRATVERLAILNRHAAGDRLAVATVDDEDGLAGFCYGFRGERGQWWHDCVCRGVGGGERAREWLGDCREIAELHVRPDAQGRGYGRALLRAALDGAAERTAALSVLDAEDSPAAHLYAAEGFTPLLSGFRFPGNRTSYAVLAKAL